MECNHLWFPFAEFVVNKKSRRPSSGADQQGTGISQLKLSCLTLSKLQRGHLLNTSACTIPKPAALPLPQ
eukprot:5381352-Amphidinium_carterae.1